MVSKTLILTAATFACFVTAGTAEARDLSFSFGRKGLKSFHFHGPGLNVHYGKDRHHRGVTRTRCGCRQVWRPAHYEIVRRKVRLPARTVKVWVPLNRDACGTRFGGQARGYYKRVLRPGPVKFVRERVRVPGRYERRLCGRHRP